MKANLVVPTTSRGTFIARQPAHPTPPPFSAPPSAFAPSPDGALTGGAVSGEPTHRGSPMMSVEATVTRLSAADV